jgi:hypothetical protein
VVAAGLAVLALAGVGCPGRQEGGRATDDQPPSGTVVVDGGAPATNDTAATLTLSATDPQGTVVAMRFSSTGASWSVPEPYATSRAWTLDGGDGTKTVYAQFEDQAGNWSAVASDEIALDTAAPTVSSVAVSDVLATSVTVTWTTSEPATSQVEYGPTTAYGSRTPVDPTLATSHGVTLTGLAPGTTHHLGVRSVDWAGNEALGSDLSFTTPAPDTTPPTVPGNLAATPVSPSRIDLSWAASSDGVGVTGYEVSRDDATVATVPGPGFSDTGLAPGSSHTYRVRALDAAGNASGWSDPATATTLGGSTVGHPELVQHVSSTANPTGKGEPGNHYSFTLPNPVLEGNCLILGVAHQHGSAFAPTPVTDTNGTWPTSPAASIADANSNVDLAIFVLPAAAGGVHTLTVHFAANLTQFQYTVSEFSDIAATDPVSGSAGASDVPAPDVHSGTFTPSSNDAGGGNLVWSLFWNDANPQSGNEATRIAAGPGFTLLDADIMWQLDASVQHASQYLVQPISAPVDPRMTVSMRPRNDPWIGLSISLRAERAGSAPAPGIRVAKVLHFTNEVPPGTLTLQAPSTGNTLVLVTHETSIVDLTSVEDSAGNAYVKVQPEADEPQYWIAVNAVTGPDLLLTLRIRGSALATSVLVYDVVGASTSPVGASSGVPSTLLDGVSVINDFPTLTPDQAEGLTLAACSLGQGPMLSFAPGAPAGAIDDYVHYAGQTDTSFMDNSDCRAHLYTSSTATQHWNWNITPNPSNSGVAAAVHLRAP